MRSLLMAGVVGVLVTAGSHVVGAQPGVAEGMEAASLPIEVTGPLGVFAAAVVWMLVGLIKTLATRNSGSEGKAVPAQSPAVTPESLATALATVIPSPPPAEQHDLARAHLKVSKGILAAVQDTNTQLALFERSQSDLARQIENLALEVHDRGPQLSQLESAVDGSAKKTAAAVLRIMESGDPANDLLSRHRSGNS